MEISVSEKKEENINFNNQFPMAIRTRCTLSINLNFIFNFVRIFLYTRIAILFCV